jgi:hypothetical protein
MNVFSSASSLATVSALSRRLHGGLSEDRLQRLHVRRLVCGEDLRGGVDVRVGKVLGHGTRVEPASRYSSVSA